MKLFKDGWINPDVLCDKRHICRAFMNTFDGLEHPYIYVRVFCSFMLVESFYSAYAEWN